MLIRNASQGRSYLVRVVNAEEERSNEHWNKATATTAFGDRDIEASKH